MKAEKTVFFVFAVMAALDCGRTSVRPGFPFPAAPGSFADFSSITPSSKDMLSVPVGYESRILISFGDPINRRGEHFGYNNDHIEFFPIPWEAKGAPSGYLFVSHEYIRPDDPVLKDGGPDLERHGVGASILRIKRDARGNWGVAMEPANRRYHSLSALRMDGPVAFLLGDRVTGTMDNCSGGQTPWGTVLSGEESLDYGSVRGWRGFDDRGVGWIVEFDPYDPAFTPVKHSALGRFKHENAAVTLAPDGRVIVYMGDDRHGGGIYKYISTGRYDAKNRTANRSLLSSGTLFGARLDDPDAESGVGLWIPIDIDDEESGAILRRRGFRSQGDLLLDIAGASEALGISGLSRPEDCEIHPIDRSVYCALTGSVKRVPPDLYGRVVTLRERGGDPASHEFTFATLAEGGPAAGFSNPDNLQFDSSGNLWLTTDLGSAVLNAPGYEFHGNNALFVVPTSGANAGRAFRFATAPSGAEFTGPWFTPDEKTLFLSVQHPGEGGRGTWPGPAAKPSVVQIRRMK